MKRQGEAREIPFSVVAPGGSRGMEPLDEELGEGLAENLAFIAVLFKLEMNLAVWI